MMSLVARPVADAETIPECFVIIHMDGRGARKETKKERALHAIDPQERSSLSNYKEYSGDSYTLP